MGINEIIETYITLDKHIVNETINYIEKRYKDIIKDLTTELEKEKKKNRKRKKPKVELVFHEKSYVNHYGNLTINDKEVGEVFLKEETISSDSNKIKLKMELTVKVPRNKIYKADGRIYKLN